MADDDTSDALNPDDRRREVAQLLATGLLRLLRRLSAPCPPPPLHSEPPAGNGLDDGRESRPHGGDDRTGG